MRLDVEKYLHDCDIFMGSKAQTYKLYDSMQVLSIPTYK